MRFLPLIFALVTHFAIAADEVPPQPDTSSSTTLPIESKKPDEQKPAAGQAKVEFQSAKSQLLDTLEYRKKMEAKVYLTRKKILDSTIECVKKAENVPSIMKCHEAERRQIFDSVKDTQKQLVEFGKKMDKTRIGLGLGETPTLEQAAMKAAAAKAAGEKAEKK